MRPAAPRRHPGAKARSYARIGRLAAFLCVYLWFLSLACAADVDLFVTDYNEDPTRDQRR